MNNAYLYVEHSVAPGLGNNEHVPGGLHAGQRLDPARREGTHVGLVELEHLLVGHNHVAGRVDDPLLRAVDQRVPGGVVVVHLQLSCTGGNLALAKTK